MAAKMTQSQMIKELAAAVGVPNKVAKSFTALATRNFTTFLAGILIASPVAGLRPMRALRSTRTRRPTPGKTATPLFLVSATASSAYAVVSDLATFVVTPTVSASFLMNCDCVSFAAILLLF